MAEGPEREGALTAQATATKRVQKQHKQVSEPFHIQNSR